MLKTLVLILAYVIGFGIIILGVRSIVSFIRDIRDHVKKKKSSVEGEKVEDALPAEGTEKEVKK